MVGIQRAVLQAGLFLTNQVYNTIETKLYTNVVNIFTLTKSIFISVCRIHVFNLELLLFCDFIFDFLVFVW